MTLTDEQLFLVAANDAAQVHDYFHWRVVGRALSWPEIKALRVLRILSELELVDARHGEEARLLPEGRLVAEQFAPDVRGGRIKREGKVHEQQD